jgi:hypothetical protein
MSPDLPDISRAQRCSPSGLWGFRDEEQDDEMAGLLMLAETENPKVETTGELFVGRTFMEVQLQTRSELTQSECTSRNSQSAAKHHSASADTQIQSEFLFHLFQKI